MLQRNSSKFFHLSRNHRKIVTPIRIAPIIEICLLEATRTPVELVSHESGVKDREKIRTQIRREILPKLRGHAIRQARQGETGVVEDK